MAHGLRGSQSTAASIPAVGRGSSLCSGSVEVGVTSQLAGSRDWNRKQALTLKGPSPVIHPHQPCLLSQRFHNQTVPRPGNQEFKPMSSQGTFHLGEAVMGSVSWDVRATYPPPPVCVCVCVREHMCAVTQGCQKRMPDHSDWSHRQQL